MVKVDSNVLYEKNSNPTQCEKILRHLIDHGTITPMEALQEDGIMRLASRISELNKRGAHIVKEIESGKNRYGERTHWARYTLAE